MEGPGVFGEVLKDANGYFYWYEGRKNLPVALRSHAAALLTGVED
jgi:hypothetical protein